MQELRVGGNDWLNQLQACMAGGKPVLLRDFNDARNATLVDLLQIRVSSMSTQPALITQS